jgi:riboflavin synthase
MFTGLVRHRATLRDRNVDGRAGSLALRLDRPEVWDDLRVGDSIAVNGCCLTITTFDDDSMSFEAGSETLARTLFEQLAIGQKMHVEQALRVGDRMDGHMVTGHVDGLGQLLERVEVAGGRRLRFGVTPELARMLPEKGSVCVDGISLTIAADEPSGFTVELIPETLEATELTRLVAGDSVHVEVDPMARYAAHWLARTGVLNAAGSET